MSVRGREYLIIPQIVIEAIEKQLRDERNAKEFEMIAVGKKMIAIGKEMEKKQ